jgi:hypothetical protein
MCQHLQAKIQAWERARALASDLRFELLEAEDECGSSRVGGIESHSYETQDGRRVVVFRSHPNWPANVIVSDEQGDCVVDVHSYFDDADFHSDEAAIAVALRLRRTTPGASP